MKYKNEQFNSIENVDELISKLFSDYDSQMVKNNLITGDKIMGKLDDIAPPAELLAGIKSKVNDKLARQNTTKKFKTFAKLTASVAAIVIIAVMLFNHNGQLVDNNTTVAIENAQTEVEGENLWDMLETDQQNNIELLSMEIEDVASDIITALNSEINGITTMSENIDNLELEIIENETIFWKG